MCTGLSASLSPSRGPARRLGGCQEGGPPSAARPRGLSSSPLSLGAGRPLPLRRSTRKSATGPAALGPRWRGRASPFSLLACPACRPALPSRPPFRRAPSRPPVSLSVGSGDDRRSWVGRILSADLPRHGGLPGDRPGLRAETAPGRCPSLPACLPADFPYHPRRRAGDPRRNLSWHSPCCRLQPVSSRGPGPAAAGRRSAPPPRPRRLPSSMRPSGGRGPGRGGPGRHAFEMPMITAFCNSH